MTQSQDSKPYDLEARTFKFAQDVIGFANSLPKTVGNIEVAKQVIRSSGSVGANYIEANEALSKKDIAVRVKICRKEAKESRYWLRLCETRTEAAETTAKALIGEALELTRIFSAIVEKTK